LSGSQSSPSIRLRKDVYPIDVTSCWTFGFDPPNGGRMPRNVMGAPAFASTALLCSTSSRFASGVSSSIWTWV
jgi:hypothetical protein